jgi:hypothetical protein
VTDERETYLANSASFDKKWEGNSFLERALARHRGDEVDATPAAPPAPELGAPTSSQPLRSPEEVIAEAMGEKPRFEAAPGATAETTGGGAGSGGTGSGSDERDTYLANSASFDKKWEGNSFIERALARHRGEKVDETPAAPPAPELGAPPSSRPLRSPEEVIAEATGQTKPPAERAAVPAPPPAPASGKSAEEEYRERRAAMDAKSSGDDWYKKAMERHRQ